MKKSVSLLGLLITLILTSCNHNYNSRENSVELNESLTPSIFTPSVEQSEQPSENVSEVLSLQLGSYYDNVNLNAIGSDLINNLRTLNSKKRKMTPGYKQLGNYYIQTDGDPNHSGNIIAFYSGKSVAFNGSFSGNVNREHVWPNSRGGSVVEGDLHMTRPTITSENGSRGNSFYVEGKKSSSGGWDPAMESFGLEKYRGISARIIFYCVIASNNLSLVDKDDDSAGNKTMGKLSDLLKWNLEYDIDDTETRRNDAVEKIQGNRNPFIDDRSLACRAWGNTNTTTKSICESYGY